MGEEVLPAIERIRDMIESGDVVLLKGRDTQKLERIALGLRGSTVRCGVKYCDKRGQKCLDCVLLERGWDGLTEFMDKRKRFQGRGRATPEEQHPV